jgi:4-hydroxybenzoate polyprenyltransferase
MKRYTQSIVEKNELQPASVIGIEANRQRLRLADIAQLLRPHQWVKSIIVVPLALLGAPLPMVPALVRLGWAVAAFILASSLSYTINDVADRNLDRAHPRKRTRPIASGRVTVPAAVTIAVFLGGLLIVVAASQPPLTLWWPIAAYLALNFCYSSWLKHTPVFDVFCVALGFVLRVVQGALIVQAPPPVWLLLSVLSLCLLMSLGKRRHEIAVAGSAHRPVLAHYSRQFLDHMILLTTAVGMVTFLLHLRFETNARAGWAPVFLAGLCAFMAVFRYLQIVFVDRGGGDPVRTLMRDRTILATGAACAALCLYVSIVPQLTGRG